MTTDARRAEIVAFYKKWHGHLPSIEQLHFAEWLFAEAEARGIANGLEMAAKECEADIACYESSERVSPTEILSGMAGALRVAVRSIRALSRNTKGGGG